MCPFKPHKEIQEVVNDVIAEVVATIEQFKVKSDRS